MSGLEKIKNQILDEANLSAQSKIEQAQREADQLLKAAKEEIEVTKKQLSEKTNAQIKDDQERVTSSIELSRKKAILAAKQQTIANVQEKAYAEILQMEDSAYFEMMKKLLDRYALSGEGTIHFSEKDLNRMPAAFEETIAEIGAAKGGSLTLSKETKNIEGGFILVYGGIEENCTLRAIFNAQKDQLADEIHKLLFI